MKKHFPKIIVLLIILAGGYFVIFMDKEDTGAPASDMAFSVDDKNKIARIYLAGKDGRTADLIRMEDEWQVNDKYKVLPDKIGTLLYTLENMQVKYPVAESAMKNVVKELATTAIKVELYRKGDKKPHKVFYVGEVSVHGDGTYMIMQVDGKTAKRAYVVNIPGFVGVLTPRFILDEDEWRDTNVFDYTLDEIKQVKMEYLKNQAASFEISVYDQDSFKVKPLNEELTGLNRKVNRQKVIAYLSSFERLNLEGYSLNERKRDSLSKEVPFAILSVTDKEGEETSMEVHLMELNKRSKLQFDEFGNQLPHDMDHYYAFVNEGKDFATIQNFVFGKVFRRYDEFLMAD